MSNPGTAESDRGPPPGTHHRAANVIVIGNDGALLLKRSAMSIFWPDYWCPPGGGVDEGESYLQAAQRELAEETGLTGVTLAEFSRQTTTVQNSPEMAALPNPPVLQRSRIGDPITLVTFWGRVAGRPAVRLDPDEHVEHAWVPLERLGTYRIMTVDREPLLNALRRAASLPG